MKMMPSSFPTSVGLGKPIQAAPIRQRLKSPQFGTTPDRLDRTIASPARQRTVPPMLQAVEQEDLGLLNALLSQGVSADAELAEDGTTPLLAAAEQNKLKAATLLIQSGAAINQGDSYNRTPLMAAALEGRYHMVQLLLSAGASARLKDEQGKTALTYAIENEHNQLAQLLLTVEDSASLLGPLELLSFATEAAREEE